MKLVAGRPLRALIAERKTIDERIGLLHHVIAVADAIAYAHGRNIIHRDLRPTNVIVGDFGETVVIDWGLAKNVSDPTDVSGGGGSLQSLDDQLTSAGSVLGTPAYMAPEQERGEPVDQRADVFAIGAILWELCSLQKVPPTDTGNVIACCAGRHRPRPGGDHRQVDQPRSASSISRCGRARGRPQGVQVWHPDDGMGLLVAGDAGALDPAAPDARHFGHRVCGPRAHQRHRTGGAVSLVEPQRRDGATTPHRLVRRAGPSCLAR